MGLGLGLALCRITSKALAEGGGAEGGGAEGGGCGEGVGQGGGSGSGFRVLLGDVGHVDEAAI